MYLIWDLLYKVNEIKTDEIDLKITKDYDENIDKLVRINILLTNKLNEDIYLENLITKTSSS